MKTSVVKLPPLFVDVMGIVILFVIDVVIYGLNSRILHYMVSNKIGGNLLLFAVNRLCGPTLATFCFLQMVVRMDLMAKPTHYLVCDNLESGIKYRRR